MSDTTVHLPDLSGRTAVVTGANSGLGLETARFLAGRGARVVLAVRDTTKGDAAAREIQGETEVRRLDLADLSSVRAFAADWRGDLGLLINNAGIMAVPKARTKDGFESQFGVNHLGHFALTNLLLKHVTGRVVTVSSGLHAFVRGIPFDDPDFTRGYTPYRAYGRSKLANLLFTLELQRRLEEVDSPVLATAAHPGYAATELHGRTERPLQDRLMRVLTRIVGQSAAVGALPTIQAATQDVPGAYFAGPTGLFFNGAPGPSWRTRAALDTDAARRLWDLSEEATGTAFPL
ncbi:oxidoreductase [Nocardiopsis sp. MG754419]|uniref:oxidoreductase n=1 Tax=Nocardiopsis sp. MG754419 TaxID=2259865 RepID=UPI001BA6F5E0|nr:oxidoreductase [Nocardiopsis sp. MG754419]MBR8743504.1 oxidoreductase [Nocardiopsis sp. MG754419]